MEIDSLYFSASQAAAANMASLQTKKQDKTEKVKTKAFASSFEKARQEHELIRDGFPLEIAGMDTEEAAIYLKDEADIAADKLKQSQLPENFTAYKKKVSQFLRFLEKNNFDVYKQDRTRVRRAVKKMNPFTQVQVINQKLDEMAMWLLSSHKDAFKILSRVEEIQGLIIDLMAV